MWFEVLSYLLQLEKYGLIYSETNESECLKKEDTVIYNTLVELQVSIYSHLYFRRELFVYSVFLITFTIVN